MQHRLIEVGFLRLLLLQMVVIAVAATALWLKMDVRHAYSALLGGLICAIPGWVFAINVFKYKGSRAATKIVACFYWGEGLKLGLTIILFTLVFIFIPIAALPFFATFIAAQLIYWFAPLVLKT